MSENKTPSEESSEAKPKPSQYSGFDAVVREERKNRKLAFGPNTKKVTKPSNILIDIYGVISSWNFVKELKDFAHAHMDAYLRSEWESKIVKAVIARLKEQVAIDRLAGIDVPPIVESEDKETVIKSATESILWQMHNKHNTTKVSGDVVGAAQS